MQKIRGIKEMMDMVDGIHSNKSKRIIMEKEKRGLTYEQLLNKLIEYKGEYIGFDSLQKKIQTKKSDDELLDDLCHVLSLKETDLSEDIAVYRYHKGTSSKRGRPSKLESEENKKKYDMSHVEHDPENGIYDMDRLIVEELLSEEEYKIGDEYFESYSEYSEELQKRNMLKKMLLIFSFFPQAVQEFVELFEFEKDELDELEGIDIQIKYR